MSRYMNDDPDSKKTLSAQTMCPICRENSIFQVPLKGYFAWKSGDLPIQEALPELSRDLREQLMTGICPKCWDATFGETEDDGPLYYADRFDRKAELLKKDSTGS